MSLFVSPDGSLSDSPLTPRERMILQLIADGLQRKQVAEKLSISYETAKKHIKNAYKKLGAHNKVDALRKSGLWSPTL